MDTILMRNSVPSEIVLSADKRALKLAWQPGDLSTRDSATLDSEAARRACRCAWCTRDRILGQFPARFEGVAFAHVAPIGSHALHIAFSDGHARGIFPWPYLRDVAHGVDIVNDAFAPVPDAAPPAPQRDRTQQ